jgi:Tubulin-tyrosine ligase family
MPLQWSAAYEEFSDLISILAVNSLYCLTVSFLDQVSGIDLVRSDSASRSTSRPNSIDPADETDCQQTKSMIHAVKQNFYRNGLRSDEMEMLKSVVAALRIDKQWQSSASAPLLTAFISALSPLSRKSVPHDRDMDEADVASDIEVLRSVQSSLVTIMREHAAHLKYVAYGGMEDIWIVKPVGLSCGEKIVCTKNIIGVLRAAKDLMYKCVVQKYIERPLLVRSHRKFDIRQWVLVTSADPLVLYGFSECYLRLSGESFSLCSDDLQRPSVHLCNHAIQKLAAKDSPGESESEGTSTSTSTSTHTYAHRSEHAHVLSNTDTYSNVGNSASPVAPIYDTMMSQQEFEAELQLQEKARQSLLRTDAVNGCIFRDRILPRIKSISKNVIQSVRDKLVREGKGFEWLGLDLMVVERERDRGTHSSSSSSSHTVSNEDQEKKERGRGGCFDVLLLEVNVSPDISPSTPVTARLVGPAVRDLFNLLLLEGAGALEDPIAVTRLDTPRNATWEASRGVTRQAESAGDRAENSGSHYHSSSSSRGRKEDSCAQSSDECLKSTEPSLRWDLWHVGAYQGKRSNVAFGRVKQEHRFLGFKTDYLPRDVSTAERVMQIVLNSSSSHCAAEKGTDRSLVGVEAAATDDDDEL